MKIGITSAGVKIVVIDNVRNFVSTAVANVQSVANKAIGSVKKNWPTFKFETLTKFSNIKNSMVESFGKTLRIVVKRFNPDAGARMSMEYHTKKLEESFSSVSWGSRKKVEEALSTLSKDTSLGTQEKTEILKTLDKKFAQELLGRSDKTTQGKLEEIASQLLNEIELLNPSKKAKELVDTTKGLKPMAEGSFGAVYKVEGNDGKTYAVKILKNADGRGLKEFEQEKKANEYLQAGLIALSEDERNLFVTYHGCYEIDGEHILITEFVEYENGKGLDFEGYIKDFHSQKDSQDPKEMMRLMEQGFKKTAIEERLGLMNRDTKPANFMVGKDSDGNLQLKGMDYGTACIHADDGEWETKGVGTPIYMAPEVLNKEYYSFSREVYSMGISLLEGLLGEAFPKTAFRFPWQIAEFVTGKGIDGAFGESPSFENWLKALYPKSDKSEDKMTKEEKVKAEAKAKAENNLSHMRFDEQQKTFLASLIVDCTKSNPQERITAEQAAYLLGKFNAGEYDNGYSDLKKNIDYPQKAIPRSIMNMISSEDKSTKKQGISALEILIKTDPSYIETETFKNLDDSVATEIKSSPEYESVL